MDDHPGSIPTLSIADGGGPGRGAWDGVPPPMVYSIRSGENRIGSFILHKADFCAGDVVLGNFDFSGASTRCLQVKIASTTFLRHIILSFSRHILLFLMIILVFTWRIVARSIMYIYIYIFHIRSLIFCRPDHPTERCRRWVNARE